MVQCLNTTTKKRILSLAYLLVLAHTIKDFFQDFLETDFLYFADANENLMILPKWGRWSLVVANQTVDIMVWLLIILTPIVLLRSRPKLEKVLLVGYVIFFVIVTTDLLLDPRITNPKIFLNKSTRTPAAQMKATYREIFHQGPF